MSWSGTATRVAPAAQADYRHQNPGGSEVLLNNVQPAYLWPALQSPAANRGQWNGRTGGRLAHSVYIAFLSLMYYGP
jgi:hypothetical protein